MVHLLTDDDVLEKTTMEPNVPGRTFTLENINQLQGIFNEEDYHTILNLIQYCKDQYFKKSSIKQLIKRIVSSECWTDYYNEKLEAIWAGTCFTPLGFQGLTDVLSTSEISIIESIIKKPSSHDLLIDPISTDKEIIVDRIHNTVQLKYKKIVNNKDMSKYETIINAAPETVKIFDSPLTETPRNFSIQWKTTLSKRPFTTTGEKGAANINEIVTYLENAGYSPNPRHLKGAVASTINCFLREGLAEVKEEVETPGFFYDKSKDKILCVKYECIEPTIKELIEAIQVLTNLESFFKGKSSIKLASALKWGWMSAFSYIKKQKGTWIPWLYLYGQAGSGKTTIGKILLYLWETPNEHNETGGSSFDSEYKVGIILNRSTLPHLINEPLGLFQRRGLFEMLKTSVEHVIARSKSINGVYTQIHGFSPIIFTANQQAPQDDAFLRRTYRLAFHFDERKTEKQKKAFKKAFNTENPNKSPLVKLQSISHYIANKIINDPDLIDEDWQQLIDYLLRELEMETKTSIPNWIYQWQETESLEDYDDDQREMLRMFFMETINNASRRITVTDENGYARPNQQYFDNDEAANNTDYKDRAMNVIGSRLIPWMFLKEQNNTLKVCITSGIKKDLHGVTQTCHELKSIAMLLGWNYGAVRDGSYGRPQKVANISFKKFVEWVYMGGYDDL
jgi:hypothetical protein